MVSGGRFFCAIGPAPIAPPISDCPGSAPSWPSGTRDWTSGTVGPSGGTDSTDAAGVAVTEMLELLFCCAQAENAIAAEASRIMEILGESLLRIIATFPGTLRQ